MVNNDKIVERPQGEIKIVNPIDNKFILRPEESSTYYDFYEYQEYYALALWALQEKFGFTYEEATFYCCEYFREGDKFEFLENVFGMDFTEYCKWWEYVNSKVSRKELRKYIGISDTIVLNLMFINGSE